MSIKFKRNALAILLRCQYAIEHLSLPHSLGQLKHDRAYRLRIPTYEGSGQAVHPDIVGLPEGGELKYALTFTPYPYTNDRFENPSIVVSKDGLRFFEERPGLNPLAPAPEIDHNDDPDFFLFDGGYGILYLETLRPSRQNLILLRSEDRRHWSSSVLVSYDLERIPNPDPLIVSPALVRDSEGYRVYYVDTSQVPHRIARLDCNELAGLAAAPRTSVEIPGLDFIPWHIDVVKGNGSWYMLITSIADRGGRSGYNLHIARSPDLEIWELAPGPVFGRMPLDARLIYRSTAVCDGGDLFVYFSYKSHYNQWRIGLTRKRVADIFMAR